MFRYITENQISYTIKNWDIELDGKVTIEKIAEYFDEPLIKIEKTFKQHHKLKGLMDYVNNKEEYNTMTDDYVFNIGKYVGCRLSRLFIEDFSYCAWVYSTNIENNFTKLNNGNTYKQQFELLFKVNYDYLFEIIKKTSEIRGSLRNNGFVKNAAHLMGEDMIKEITTIRKHRSSKTETTLPKEEPKSKPSDRIVRTPTEVATLLFKYTLK